jgi:hypothetical protein
VGDLEEAMTKGRLRPILLALAAMSALTPAAGARPALATDVEPEAEAWRIVCTLDGREVLRREPVYRIWHDGEDAAVEPASAAAPGATVCRWERLGEEPAGEAEAGLPAPVWEAPDLGWLSPAAPARRPAEIPGPRQPVLITSPPAFRAAPAAVGPGHVALAPVASEAGARAAWLRLRRTHARLLAGRTP